MEPRKKAKETDAIKEKLERYKAMPRRIDNLIERLEALNSSMGSPSTPNLTGLPSGGGDGTTKIEREVLRKLELEEKIRKLVKDERDLRHELETLIERMASSCWALQPFPMPGLFLFQTIMFLTPRPEPSTRSNRYTHMRQSVKM